MTKLIALMPTPGGLTGAPRRLLTLASVLKGQGHEVCIAAPSGSELFNAAVKAGHETAAVDAVGVLSLRHRVLFGDGLWFRVRVMAGILRLNWRLRCCIQKRKADVVWIRGSKGIAFGVLGTIASGRPMIWDVDYELPSRGMVRWLHLLGLWAASAVVFQHAAAPDAIFGQKLALRHRHKFDAIIPGVDLQALEPFAEKRKSRTNSNDEPFVILQVGTICDRKNQVLLISALGELVRSFPAHNYCLLLAGDVFDEVYAEELRRLVRILGLESVVHFLGWRTDVHELMTRADLLAMPSKDEGVPNTVQEAMAIGLPVVVSAAGGMTEILTNGETGWVLNVDDPTGWAKQVKWCHDHRDDCEAIGQRASVYAFEWFGTEHWGTEYARVIESLTMSLSNMKRC